MGNGEGLDLYDSRGTKGDSLDAHEIELRELIVAGKFCVSCKYAQGF